MKNPSSVATQTSGPILRWSYIQITPLPRYFTATSKGTNADFTGHKVALRGKKGALTLSQYTTEVQEWSFYPKAYKTSDNHSVRRPIVTKSIFRPRYSSLDLAMHILCTVSTVLNMGASYKLMPDPRCNILLSATPPLMVGMEFQT